MASSMPGLLAEAVVLNDAVVLLVAPHGLESRLIDPDSPGLDLIGLAGFLVVDGHAEALARRRHGLDDQVVVAGLLIDVGYTPDAGRLARPVHDLHHILLFQQPFQIVELFDRLLGRLAVIGPQCRRAGLVDLLCRGPRLVVLGNLGQHGHRPVGGEFLIVT